MLEEEQNNNGVIDTNNFSSYEIVLLAFASQLDNDIGLDWQMKNAGVLEELARLHDLDPSNLQKLVREAMDLLNCVEQATGTELEGW